MTAIDFTEVPAPGPWREEGLCRGAPVSAFFAHTLTTLARQLCGECPVSGKCRAYALENNMAGTWGGTTWEQRRRLRH